MAVKQDKQPDNQVAAETDETQTNETQATEAKANEQAQAPEFSFHVVNTATVGELAAAIWSRAEGKNHDEKAKSISALFDAVREVRDAGKTTKPRRSLAELIAESINKPMGDLQAVKVPVGGVTLPIPQVVKAAMVEDGKETPFTAPARQWMEANGLTVQKRKVSSRGKESIFLVKAEPKVEETSVEA